MKIVVLDGYTENPGDLSWDGFSALGELTVYDRTPVELIVERIGDAEIVITNKTPITAKTLAECKKIAYIGVLATGYNIVDVEAARAAGVPVCNIPTYGTAAVAQFTFALLLELCHHVGVHSDAVFAGEWENSVDFCFYKSPLIELAGKTMGLIGYGKIGRAVANIARAFGMDVLAYDEYVDDPVCVSFDTLLEKSDIISLHCPLTLTNANIINAAAISKMKRGVMLINTARGPLVDERALYEALESGQVSAAAVDVVSQEPIKSDNPLLRAKNCVMTPHIAWAPIEARTRLMDIAVQNVKAFLDGKPVNVVNG